jgi:hypothetical protein
VTEKRLYVYTSSFVFTDLIQVGFLHSLVREAYHRPLKADDMLELQEELKSESAVPIFENAWRDEVQRLRKFVYQIFSLILI